ncbi:ion channel [Nitzschia inconspicua]|uniref:Ion channel n=1 Tax=Nitzschia inconspicua TaxID=303405 RepID=A0A9K3PG69_9STRA|nr:ion channel [Nitzschia inconspicua]
MVLNREVKPDVFAPFENIIYDKNDNTNLMIEQKERQENRVTVENGRTVPKEDIFAQFRLPVVDAVEKGPPSTEGNTIDCENSGDNDTSQQNRDKKKTFLNRFRRHDGTRMGLETNDNYGDEKMEQENDKVFQHNPPVGTVSLDDDWKNDTDDGGGGAKVPKSTNEAAPAHPPGETDLLDSQSYWESPANDIFADFDLNAIVRDYEKLQRKVNYAPPKETHDNVEEENLKLQIEKMRYKNVKEWWLNNFPRCHGIIFRVLIPQCILLLIAMGLGYILAGFEVDDEYWRNDDVMARRFTMESFSREESVRLLLGLPTFCFNSYITAKGRSVENLEIVNDTSLIQQSLGEKFESKLMTVSPAFSSNVDETLLEMETYMQACEDAAANVTTRVLYDTIERADVMAESNTLTFDWIRCWNMSTYGEVNPFRATAAQIEASDRQAAFYADVWKADQVRLYEQYLSEANCSTVECRNKAYSRSIDDATGSSMCDLNNGAAAWFWFTIMTTTGYGNQAPVTNGGRALVGCFAWITVIVWALILYVAGQVLSIIMDDFFRKCHMQFMTRGIFSAILWGFLGFLWIVVIAELGYLWWNSSRSPPNGHVERSDAMWWAYISMLTVGLGDFYLEPEFIFFQDVFVWAFVFLVGFTFLSTFLNQMGDLCKDVFPDSGEALKERLRNTHLVGMRAVHYKEKNEKVLQNISDLVEKMDDDSVSELVLRLTRIRQKKELLVHLLHQTQDELDYFANRGEKYEDPPLPRVAKEEIMLSEVLEKTSHEREKIERYRQRILSESVSLPVASSSHPDQQEKEKRKKRGKLPFFVPLAAFVTILSRIPCSSASSSTGFPGMIPSNPIQPHSQIANHTGYSDPSSPLNSQNSSDDDDESSSDWDESLIPDVGDNIFTKSQEFSKHSKSAEDSHATSKSEELNDVRGIGKGPSRTDDQISALHHSRLPSNKPLRTLEKLQQLLDETDYMTTSSSAVASFKDEAASDNENRGTSMLRSSSASSSNQEFDPLWTSKDRQKYKKQQYFQEQMQRQQSVLPQISDNEDVSDTDDGLGYTLPNLPVYLSDDEGDSMGTGLSLPTQLSQQQHTNSIQYPPLTSQQQQQAAASLAHQQFLQQQRDLYLAQQHYQQQLHFLQKQQQLQLPQQFQTYNLNHHTQQGGYTYPTSQYPYVPDHPGLYALPQRRELHQHSFNSVPQRPKNYNHYPRQVNSFQSVMDSNKLPQQTNMRPSNQYQPSFSRDSFTVKENDVFNPAPPLVYVVPSDVSYGMQTSKPPLMYRIGKIFISTQRILLCACLATIVSYAAVSPRSLNFVEYNQKFYENLLRVALVVLPPLCLYGWAVVDWSGGGDKIPVAGNVNNIPFQEQLHGNSPIHDLIRAMSRSFTLGYMGVFVLEIVLTTFLRLAVFSLWEPNLFGPPQAPSAMLDGKNGFSGGSSLGLPPPAWFILPWVLREHKFRVKRITLLIADFLTSCVAAPIVEEVSKLLLLQWTVPLSKNFNWVRRSSKHSKNKIVAEPISAHENHSAMGHIDRVGQRDGMVTYINPYISGMLAVSLGLKWADAIRRVCMYTKAKDEHKAVYALLRGLFPVQELCGCMTALRLARRDVLGQKMPLWSILLPSIVVHGMANFRGMKPFFKWNSSSPWSEMQLSRDTFSSDTLSVLGGGASSATYVDVSSGGLRNFARWLGKEFPRITWLIILFRVAGYCIKNYYMINRQAYKRISTYAGKHSAFSAELETAEKLKQTAKEKKR